MRYHVVQHRSLLARTRCECFTYSPFQQFYPINTYLWSLQQSDLPPPPKKNHNEIIQFQRKICNSRANLCEGEYFFVVANDLYRHNKTAPPPIPSLRGLDNDTKRRTTSFLYRKWCCRCLNCSRLNILHSCIHLHLHLLTIII